MPYNFCILVFKLSKSKLSAQKYFLFIFYFKLPCSLFELNFRLSVRCEFKSKLCSLVQNTTLLSDSIRGTSSYFFNIFD